MEATMPKNNKIKKDLESKILDIIEYISRLSNLEEKMTSLGNSMEALIEDHIKPLTKAFNELSLLVNRNRLILNFGVCAFVILMTAVINSTIGYIVYKILVKKFA